MKMKSTLIILSLIFGLISCSKDKGMTPTTKTSPTETALKAAASTTGQMHMHFRAVNNVKYDATTHQYTQVFDSAGGILTKIVLVKKGNPKLGIKEKRVVAWDQVEHFDDLLFMGTGMMGDLLIINIPPGSYDKAIVSVSNGWVLKDGTKYPLKFPSNKMTLAFKPSVLVATQLSPDVTFDIDMSKSFSSVHGDSYVFHPHVKVVNATTAGSLAGAVINGANGEPIPGAYVLVNADGEIFPTQTLVAPYDTPWGTLDVGEYFLNGVPEGSWTATAQAPGFSPSSTPVTIIKGNITEQVFILLPQ